MPRARKQPTKEVPAVDAEQEDAKEANGDHEASAKSTGPSAAKRSKKTKTVVVPSREKHSRAAKTAAEMKIVNEEEEKPVKPRTKAAPKKKAEPKPKATKASKKAVPSEDEKESSADEEEKEEDKEEKVESEEEAKPAKKVVKGKAAEKEEDGEEEEAEAEDAEEDNSAEEKQNGKATKGATARKALKVEHWNALSIASVLKAKYPELEVVMNEQGKTPRRGAFELNLVVNDGPEQLLWSGLKKGPPRKEKFPDASIIEEAFEKALL